MRFGLPVGGLPQFASTGSRLRTGSRVSARSLALLRRWWPLCALVAAAALATASVGSGFIVANDYTEMQVDPLGFLRRLGLAWVPNIYLGYHSGFMHAYATPYGWLSALLQLVHVEAAARQRILDFTVFFAIAGGAYWGIAFMAPATTRSARVCGALVYLLNPYVAFNVGNGTSNMLAPYAALPFLTGITALSIRGRLAPVVGGILAGVVVFFGGGINVPLIAMNAVVVTLYALIALAGAPSTPAAWRRFVPFACAGVGAAVVLDLYWLAPFLDYVHTFWLGGLLDESPKEHSAESSFANVLRGLGQWSIFRGDDAGPWYLWAGAYVLPFFSWLLWFPPLLGALGLAVRRRFGVAAVFFAALAAISVPLAVGYYQGAAGPAVSTPIYDFLYTKVPGFAMFRSAYKWVWPFEFASAGLVALAVSALQGRVSLLRRARPQWLARPIWRAALPTFAALLVLVGFGPILSAKMYHPNLPLPSWTLDESRFVGSDRSHRLALFPGQYLEWYDWLDRSFQLEAQLIDKPLVDGYMTGAPAEESHVLLTRAYKLARAGDPRAADIFRALSVDDVLQRDDYRSLMDFAFVGSWVPTDTSLAHDLLTRVLRARPHARDAANRLYALDGALPMVFGTANARLDPRPALDVAASGDYARIARGETAVSLDDLSPSALGSLVPALTVSAGDGAARDAAATLLQGAGARVECFASPCRVTIAGAGPYHVLVAALSVYPSDFREAFDLPSFDFTHADGIAVPSAIEIDDRLHLRSDDSARTWHDFGVRRLAAGTHTLTLPGASPTTPALVAIIPASRWIAEYARVREAFRTPGRALHADDEVAVQAHATSIDVPADGLYALSASPRRELGTAAVRGPNLPAARLSPQPGFGASSWAPPGALLELPYVPGAGMLALNAKLMPAAWYLDRSLYTWNRGSPTDWFLLEPDSRLRVVVPFAVPVRASLSLRLAGVTHAVRPFTVFVDGQRRGTFVIGGGGGALPDDAGRAPLGTERPVQCELPLELTPGAHDVRLSTPAVATWSAHDVDPSSAFTQQVVAALGADVTFTVRVPHARTAPRLTQPSTHTVGFDEVDVALPTARGTGDAPFAVIRVPLDGDRLDGVPTISLTASSEPGSGLEWLAVAVADDSTHSHVRYRILSNVGVGGAFGLAPSRLLPNSPSDANRRLLGAWLVLGEGAEHAAGPARIDFRLRDLHVERSLPAHVPATNVGSLALRVDGRNVAGSTFLRRGRHRIEAAAPNDDIGVLRVRSAGVPLAHAIPIRVERASAVALDVRRDAAGPPFVLVLNESYHPEWQATLDGRVLAHVHANGFANGWIVPASRSPQVVQLRFTAQRSYFATAWISLLGGLACVGGLIFWRR